MRRGIYRLDDLPHLWLSQAAFDFFNLLLGVAKGSIAPMLVTIGMDLSNSNFSEF